MLGLKLRRRLQKGQTVKAVQPVDGFQRPEVAGKVRGGLLMFD